MSELIYGKTVVLSALEANRRFYNVYISYSKDLDEIIFKLKEKKIPYKEVPKSFLDKKTKGVHQGVIAEVEEYKYYSLSDIIGSTKSSYPLLIILDGIEDPHNLGAIIRTCDAAGVDGIIIPKHRSVRLSDTVAKVSTGAIEYVKVAQVANLTNTIKELKKNSFWIVGAEYNSKSVDYTTLKYDMPVALVIGSEGRGISRLVKENCDFLVKIPMKGKVNSLNASVSAGILIYEIIKYR